MIFFRDDEEKRSKAFIIVTVAAVVVIVLIVSFFVRKGFVSDPLEGTWIYAESDWRFTFDGEEGLTVVAAEAFDGSEVRIPMKYVLERENKMVTLSINEEKLSDAIREKPEEVAEEDVRAFTEDLEKSYDYSVDGNELTLTEADGGDALDFHRE